MASKHVFYIPAVTLTLMLAGCGNDHTGPARAAISGQVMLDGTELREGIVRFRPSGKTEGPLATAEIIEGQFAMPKEYGPLVGTHTVEVESTDTGGLVRDDEQAFEELKAMSRPPQIKVVRVPVAYHRNSPLMAEVTADGPNTFLFELETPKRRRR